MHPECGDILTICLSGRRNQRSECSADASMTKCFKLTICTCFMLLQRKINSSAEKASECLRLCLHCLRLDASSTKSRQVTPNGAATSLSAGAEAAAGQTQGDSRGGALLLVSCPAGASHSPWTLASSPPRRRCWGGGHSLLFKTRRETQFAEMKTKL